MASGSNTHAGDIVNNSPSLINLQGGATDSIFQKLKQIFATQKVTVSVSCQELPCGGRKDNKDFPYPTAEKDYHPLPPTATPLKTVSGRPLSLPAELAEAYPQLEGLAGRPVYVIAAIPELGSLQLDRTTGLVEPMIISDQMPVLAKAGEKGGAGPGGGVVLADSGTPGPGAGAGTGTTPTTTEMRYCKSFWGPITSSGGGSISLNFAITGTYGTVTATITFAGSVRMTTKVVSFSKVGSCDPPSCTNETKLIADVDVRFVGDASVTASASIDLPPFGKLGGAAAAVNFHIECSDIIPVEVMC